MSFTTYISILKEEFKMKKRLLLTLTIIIITIISLAACTQIEDQISKEEAQELVIEKHSKSIGNVKMIEAQIE